MKIEWLHMQGQLCVTIQFCTELHAQHNTNCALLLQHKIVMSSLCEQLSFGLDGQF